jgi:hypothetical protein
VSSWGLGSQARHAKEPEKAPRTLFKSDTMGVWTKLRPAVHAFLFELGSRYDALCASLSRRCEERGSNTRECETETCMGLWGGGVGMIGTS